MLDEFEEECETGFCEVTGPSEDEIVQGEQYSSRFDKDLNLEFKSVKEQITDDEIECGFVTYARWAANSLEVKSEFDGSTLKFIDIENYMEDLQGRGIKKVPAIILKDKVINDLEEVKKYLNELKG